MVGCDALEAAPADGSELGGEHVGMSEADGSVRVELVEWQHRVELVGVVVVTVDCGPAIAVLVRSV